MYEYPSNHPYATVDSFVIICVVSFGPVADGGSPLEGSACLSYISCC
jgi:hypothetical protein